MVQIAMVVCGIATGLACRTWQQALRIILAVFVVVLPVQTVAVASHAFEAAADVVIYVLIQIVSLAIGLAIARALVRRRDRRRVAA